jgi:hypothetical protein
MASLDSLPPDQRAVLQLVLQRGRSYDQIAAMLSIDRAAVRDRALTAFDLIAPDTDVPAPRRALITDYLMGQLPPRVADQVQDRLASSAAERAWARALASELTPLARQPLPEIPNPADRGATRPRVAAAGAPAAEAAAEAAPERPRRRRPAPARVGPADASETDTARSGEERISPAYGLRDPEPLDAQRSSRRGGAILIGAGVVVAAAIIIIVIAVSGGSSKHTSSGPSASNIPTTSTPGATTSTPATGSTPTTGTSTTSTQLVGRVNLSSPAGGSSPVGQAEIVRQGANEGVVVVGQGLPANTKHNAYAVWLSNSGSDSHLLGFVNPAVKADGKLQTAGVLPANASHFKQLLVTVETQGHPTAPGTIVLQGALNLK